MGFSAQVVCVAGVPFAGKTALVRALGAILGTESYDTLVRPSQSPSS